MNISEAVGLLRNELNKASDISSPEDSAGSGWKVHVRAEVSSTMEWAVEHNRSAEGRSFDDSRSSLSLYPRQAFIALSQTAGRGQAGRKWESVQEETLYPELPALYATFVVGLRIQARQLHGVTLSTGVAIASSLRTFGLPVRLKWPNDVILSLETDGFSDSAANSAAKYAAKGSGYKKIAGILVETAIRSASSDKESDSDCARLHIGIGVNLNQRSFPPGLPAISARIALGRDVSLPAFFQTVLSELGARLEEFESLGMTGVPESKEGGSGVSLLEAYREYSIDEGQKIRFPDSFRGKLSWTDQKSQ